MQLISLLKAYASALDLPPDAVQMSKSVDFLDSKYTYKFDILQSNVQSSLNVLDKLKSKPDKGLEEVCKRIIGLCVAAIAQFGTSDEPTEALLKDVLNQIGKEQVPDGIYLPSEYYRQLLSVSFQGADGTQLEPQLELHQDFMGLVSLTQRALEARTKK